MNKAEYNKYIKNLYKVLKIDSTVYVDLRQYFGLLYDVRVEDKPLVSIIKEYKHDTVEDFLNSLVVFLTEDNWDVSDVLIQNTKLELNKFVKRLIAIHV